MRLYTFINFYLSSIQQGIQTAHILGEIINKYDDHPLGKAVRNFNRNHKTIVVCNGGNGDSIRELIEFLDDAKHNPFPWATFNEDAASLDGALTGVGIVLPENVYEVSSEMIPDPANRGMRKRIFRSNLDPNIVYDDPDTYTYQLIDRVKSCPLAR